MDRPEEILGAIVIRTQFGEIAAGQGNFAKPIEELMTDRDWCEAVQLEGGPFCYAPWTLHIPF